MLLRAAAIVLLVAAAQPATADVRGEAMLRNLINTIDSAEDWSATVDTIRSAGADTFAEGVSVTRDEPQLSFRLRAIRVRDLNPTGNNGAFTASEIEATGFEAAGDDDGRFTIPTAAAREVAMPSFAGLTVDVHRLMSSIAQFYTVAAQGEIGEIVIPEATGSGRDVPEGGTEPVETQLTYRNLRMEGFRNGVIERQSAGPITISSNGPQGPGEATIENIFIEQFDFAAVARIFDEDQYEQGRRDGDWANIIAAIGYSGISGTGPDNASFRLGEFRVEKIEGRQPEKPFTRDFDRLLDPTMPEDQKADLALEAVRNMYSAFRLGEMTMAGLDFSAPAENSSFSLGGIALAGLSTAGLESFRIEAVKGEGPGGSGSLDLFEIRDLVFPDIDALMKFAALEADANEREHADAMRATFAALPRLAHLGLRDIAGAQAGAPAAKLGSFTFDMADWNEFFAQSTDIRLEALEIPRALMDLDPQATEVLNGLGINDLSLSASFSDRWSPQSGQDVGTWSLSLRDAAEIEFTYTLTGVTPDWILAATAQAARTEDSTAASLKMLEGLGLQRATLKITDRSLLDRGFGLAAKMQGLAVEGPAYREQMRGALPFLLSAAVPPDINKLLSEPLQTFLGGGQTLVAEIAPPQPIPLIDLMNAANLDPMQIPGVVGLTLRSEAAAPAP
jgi:hypothetical protein